MKLEEIDAAMAYLKVCPKCGSSEGFWFTIKSERLFVLCKSCGVKVEFCEIYRLSEKRQKHRWLRIFR